MTEEDGEILAERDGIKLFKKPNGTFMISVMVPWDNKNCWTVSFTDRKSAMVAIPLLIESMTNRAEPMCMLILHEAGI